MFPRIRYKNLHGFVNRRTESHQQTEKQRIDTVNIIKVDQLQLLPAESTKQIDSDKQREDDHEIRSMRIAEKMDCLRNAVRRYKRFFQFCFTYPSLLLLCVCQLHPDTVHTVGRMDGKLGNNHPVSFIQCNVCILYGETFHRYRIGDYFQIGIPCIMPVIKIVQRVFRLLRQLLGSKIGAPIMTGRKKQQTQQQPHDRTAQSSTELFSAEKKLRKIPYISVGESFHCAAFTFI